MGWIKNLFVDRAYQCLLEQNKLLQIQINDLYSQMERKEKEWRDEREKLVEKIMTMADPAAYRLLHPAPQKEPVKPLPQRLHWPGLQPPRRRPLTPQQVAEQEIANGTQDLPGQHELP